MREGFKWHVTRRRQRSQGPRDLAGGTGGWGAAHAKALGQEQPSVPAGWALGWHPVPFVSTRRCLVPSSGRWAP